mmetsp:Transcript_2457/g.3315  ORF Transcript_2457/g.3315 Transcript_2457/m.3315 type:complete len:584 (-) Transcript_2457:161-1912(-)
MLQQRLRSKTVGGGGATDHSGARFRWSKPKVVTERERQRLMRHRNQVMDRQRRMGMKETEIEAWASKILASGFRAMIKNQRAKRAAIHQQQMDLSHLRDFWNILTSVKGLPVFKQKRTGGKPVKRFMWVDEEMWRLMCHTTRSMSRKDVSGLFLLDISSVWRGCRTQAFKRLLEVKGVERDPACCMSLVGSERTIDMVFSSSSEREAMYQLFSLLVKSVHQKAKEKGLSQYQQLNKVKKRNKFTEFMSALNLVRLLQGPKGLRVTLCLTGAKKEPRNLRMVEGGRLIPAHLSRQEIEEYNEKAKVARKQRIKKYSKDMNKNTFEDIHREARKERTSWSKKKNSNFWGMLSGNVEFVDYGATRGTEEGMFMVDVVDCRPGMFSPVFADLIGVMKQNIKYYGVNRKELDNLDLVTVTLIGAERTFSLEFPTQRERDNFVGGMSALITRCSSGDEALIEAMLLRPLQTANRLDQHDLDNEFDQRESRESNGGGFGGFSNKPKGKFFGSSFRDNKSKDNNDGDKTTTSKVDASYDMLATTEGDLGGVEIPVFSNTPTVSGKAALPTSGLLDIPEKGGLNGGKHEAML